MSALIQSNPAQWDRVKYINQKGGLTRTHPKDKLNWVNGNSGPTHQSQPIGAEKNDSMKQAHLTKCNWKTLWKLKIHEGLKLLT